MMGKTILIGATNFSLYCKTAKQLLIDKGYKLIENPNQQSYTYEELETFSGYVDGVISGMEKWEESLLKQFKKLKVIIKFGTGVDTIDVEAAKKNAITVGCAKGLNAVSVANMTVTLMLAVLRKLVIYHNTTINGKWVRGLANDLDGKTVGFLGFGNIAQKAAKRLSGFDVKMIAYDKYIDSHMANSLNVNFCGFEELLSESDILSVHLPLNSETFHIISKKELSMMKKKSIIINTARGSVIDEDALYQALKEGTIYGAGLDVYENEPTNIGNPLFSLDNVVCTPHTSAETYESYY
jgi:D-3-phosphoglycerate dehydrogenase